MLTGFFVTCQAAYLFSVFKRKIIEEAGEGMTAYSCYNESENVGVISQVTESRESRE